MQMTREQSRAIGQQRYQAWRAKLKAVAADTNAGYNPISGRFAGDPDAAMEAMLLNSEAQNYLSPFAIKRIKGMGPTLATMHGMQSMADSGNPSPTDLGTYIANAAGNDTDENFQPNWSGDDWVRRLNAIKNQASSVYGGGSTGNGDLDAWYNSDAAPGGLTAMTALTNKARYSPMFSGGINQVLGDRFKQWESGVLDDAEVGNWKMLLENLGMWGTPGVGGSSFNGVAGSSGPSASNRSINSAPYGSSADQSFTPKNTLNQVLGRTTGNLANAAYIGAGGSPIAGQGNGGEFLQQLLARIVSGGARGR